MIKLIATDIDGTALKSNEQYLDPEYFPVLEKILNKGIHFCVASGRQYESLEKLFEPLKDHIYFITENGAQIIYKNKLLSYRPMTLSDSRQLVKDTRKLPGAECFYAAKSGTYFSYQDKQVYELMSKKFLFKGILVDDLLSLEEPCMKFSVFHPDKIEEVTSPSFIPKWKKTHQVECGGKYFMDVMAKGISKGSALSWLQNKLNILPEETMAFGDNENDVEMFAVSKYSIAVSNARKEVKDAAFYVTKSNDEAGVLNILKKWGV